MTIQRVLVTASRTLDLDTADYTISGKEGDEDVEGTVEQAMAQLKQQLDNGDQDLSEFFESSQVDVVKA